MKVKEAMHKGVDWVSPDTPVPELARLMRDRDVGAVPIGENDRSARLTHTSRCLFANLAAMPGSLAILAAMRRAPFADERVLGVYRRFERGIYAAVNAGYVKAG
jgi:CBS domain-containing protein